MSFMMITSGQVALELGARCGHDMDCQDTIRHSQCSMAGLCECIPYYAQFNDTSCVQGEFSVRFRFLIVGEIVGWQAVGLESESMSTRMCRKSRR